MEPVVLAAEQREDERGIGEGEVKDRDGEGEEAAAAHEGRWGVRRWVGRAAEGVGRVGGVCAAQLVRFRLKLIPMRGSDEGACIVISAARLWQGQGMASGVRLCTWKRVNSTFSMSCCRTTSESAFQTP